MFNVYGDTNNFSRKVKNYTKEEKQFILENHDKMSREEMANSLGRTVNSINKQCMLIGVTTKRRKYAW